MFKRIFKWKHGVIPVFVSLMIIATIVWAGTPQRLKYGLRFEDEGASHSTPPSGFLDMYVNSDVLYVKTDGGTETSVMLSGTAWDDLSVPDNNESLDHTTYTTTWDFGGTADMFNLDFTGDFADVSGMVLEQKTGTPTDGTLLELIIASEKVDALTIYNSDVDLATTNTLLTLDFEDDDDAQGIFIKARDAAQVTTVFQVGQGGDVIISETTTINETALDFAAGAGSINSGAGTAISILPDDGASAGEDFIVTANNITISAAGALAIPADTTLAIALDMTDTDITTGLSVGTNKILLTTGTIEGGAAIIDFTYFDVANDGDVSCVDLTVSGNMSITGSFEQSALTPAGSAPQNITIDAKTSGTITIGGTSTGAIWLGDNSGGATAVTVGDGTDVTIGEGILTIDNDQNEDAFVITSSATSNSVIEITNAATTTGKMISANADDLLTAGVMLYLDSDNIAADNYYIALFDGSGGYNFSVSQYGAVVIEGNASTDVLTLTAGDLQITAGDIDLDNGQLMVDTAQDIAHNISRAYAGGTSPVLTVADTDGSSTNAALNVTSAGASATALKIDQTGSTNGIGIDLNIAGDYPGIDIDASAARLGNVIDIAMANQVAEKALSIDGAWTGTTEEGLIDIAVTGNLAGQASLLRLSYATGTKAATGNGFMLDILDTSGAKATSYAVNIASTNNEALNVPTGKVKITEQIEVTGGANFDDPVDIDMDAANETVDITATADSYTAKSGVLMVEHTDTTLTNQQYLIKLQYTANNTANADFILCIDDSGSGKDEVFAVGNDGATVIAGTASGTDALTLTAGDILVTAGHIDITTGNLTVATGNISLTTGNLQTDVGHAAIGIGTADIETWETSIQLSALQLGGAGFWAAARVQAASDSSYFGHNAYLDDGNSRWEAISTGASDQAVMLQMTDGTWIFNVEDTAIAGDAAITWIPSLIIEETGDVGIGPATAAAIDTKFHVEEDNAATSAVVVLQRLSVTSTGTPAANLGSSLEFEVETAAGSPGNQEILAAIDGIATSVGSGTEDGGIVFKTMTSGSTATEKLRIDEDSIDATSTINANGNLTGDGATQLEGIIKRIENHTSGDTLTIAESGSVHTNSGAGATVTLVLPQGSTANGVYYTFVIVTDTKTLNIDPADGTDYIQGITNAAGDSIQSSAIGDSITLLCVGDDMWVVESNNNSNGNADGWADAG